MRRGFTPGFVNYKRGCTRLAAASDKVYQLLAHGRWFSLGTLASSTTKTGRHDIAEIMLKVALNVKIHIHIHNYLSCPEAYNFIFYTRSWGHKRNDHVRFQTLVRFFLMKLCPHLLYLKVMAYFTRNIGHSGLILLEISLPSDLFY